ncbi:DnaJ domain family protein [Leishmania donovani]|uniref:DnaJ domain family protein n=1 Tax=Leishmania donovani TaxID=5661 RepID=A0A504Y539_LEIDO|nr:DnaJ domain family protein [Leishmania donovani]
MARSSSSSISRCRWCYSRAAHRALLCSLLVVLLIGGPSAVFGVEADDDTIRLLLAAGDKALGQGRAHYGEALSKYTAVLTRWPKNERALYSRAELYSMMRERAAALDDLNALLTINKDHPQGLALRMSLNTQLGNLVDAHRDGKHLVRVYKALNKPDNFVGLVVAAGGGVPDAANDAVLMRKYRECVDVLARIIREFSVDSVELRLRRAACALAADDNIAATQELKYVTQRSPQNLNAIALNAQALRRLGALDQSMSELRRCLNLDPEYAPCANLHKLIRQQQRMIKSIEKRLQDKKFEAVVRLIAEARAAEPHAPYEEQLAAWHCEALVSLRNTDEGIRVCQMLVDRYDGANSPTVFDAHIRLAELHLLDDNIAAAEAALQKAREMRQHDGKVEEMRMKIEKLKRTGARKDYYKILGLKKTASAQDIRRAYRKLAKSSHPDQLRSKDMTDREREKQEKMFRDVNEAKEVLLDEEKRFPEASLEVPGGFPGGFPAASISSATAAITPGATTSRHSQLFLVFTTNAWWALAGVRGVLMSATRDVSRFPLLRWVRA